MSSEETLGEYVKALVKVDRLDSSSLLQTLQVQSGLVDSCDVLSSFAASTHATPFSGASSV